MRRLIVAITLALNLGLAVAAPPPAPAPGASVSGKVLEVLEVEGFTYLRLKTRDGELWAAVSRAPVKAGAEVTINDTNLMTNFESRKLNRKFDRIVFGSLAGAAQPAAGAMLPAGTPRRQPRVARSRRGSPSPTSRSPKASGPEGRTVAEVVAKRTELKDKPVQIRGKVVKFTPGVMGKNWIHLRDGTGSAADGSDDLTITTKDETAVGAVVLVKGVVRIDRDLGIRLRVQGAGRGRDAAEVTPAPGVNRPDAAPDRRSLPAEVTELRPPVAGDVGVALGSGGHRGVLLQRRRRTGRATAGSPAGAARGTPRIA